MPAFTTSQVGNWDAPATWGGAGVPGAGDTATLNHVVTAVASFLIDGITINAALNINIGVFSLRGNGLQGNGTLTFSAGTGWLFDTTLADRKWLFGTASNQTNCKVIFNGTLANPIFVTKTGSNRCWFDSNGEGSGAIVNCGGLEGDWVNFQGITNSTGMAWGSSDFGVHHRILRNCTFDACGTFFVPRPSQWSGASGKSFIVEDNTWINTPSNSNGIRYYYGAAGVGPFSFRRNACDCLIYLGGPGSTVKHNYFGKCPAMNGALYFVFEENVVISTATLIPTSTATFKNNYMLADHVDPSDRVFGMIGVGNPHFVSVSGPNAIFEDNIMEYPHLRNIDGGDGFFGSNFGAGLIQRNLIIPSMTDGEASTNLHAVTDSADGVRVLHNTIVGKITQLTYNERGAIPLTSFPCISEMKSNLAVGESQLTGTYPEWAALLYDLHSETTSQPDMVDPVQVKNNACWWPVIYTDIVTGQAHNGIRARLTSVPDSSNMFFTSGSPQFVDTTRNAAMFAVYKGVVSPPPVKPALPVNTSNPDWQAWYEWKRLALDAFDDLMMTDPMLGINELIPWVRGGFEVQNTVLNGAGHDGLTIGALPFAGGAPPPTTGGARHIGIGGGRITA